jgi:predicted KAP-like P-loop ATPase
MSERNVVLSDPPEEPDSRGRGPERMGGSPVTPSLLADSPVADPKLDRLGRFGFACSLAASILGLKGQDSIVVGLCGPWGAGKTSVLNFLEAELADSPPEDRPLVLHFNPWWFSGQDRLLQAFLQQLGAVLNRVEKDKPLKKASALLGKLSVVLKPVGLIPVVGEYAKLVQEAANSGAEAAKHFAEAMASDLNQLRKEIDDLLRQAPNRIVVVMDDIDRLVSGEIAQLFAILKAVADFPNTVYVLAYDERVVRKAVRTTMGVNGKTYLEKIVQLRIDLPVPDKTALYQLFLEQLAELVGDARPALDGNCTDFWNLFHAGLKDFLATPRAVKRLMNVLRFTYPPLRGEVHWPDLVGVGCLTAFAPEVARTIAEHPDRFVGTTGEREDREDRKGAEVFHKGWLAKVDGTDRGSVEAVVRRLFPKADTALGGSRYGRDFEPRWRARLLVRSEAHFDKYFRLSIPSGVMSEAEWRELLAALPDRPAFSQRLLDECGRAGPHGHHSRAKEALDRFNDFVRIEATPDQAGRVFEAVMSVADQLAVTHDKDVNIPFLDNGLRMTWLLKGCLAKLDPPERVRLLDTAVEQPGGLLTACELVIALGYEHGMYSESKDDHQPTDPPLVERREVERLAGNLVRKVEEAAAGGGLAAHPLFMEVVGRWRQFGYHEAAAEWLRQFAESDENLVRVVRVLKGEIQSRSFSDYVPVRTPTVSCGYLAKFIPATQLRQRCADILVAAPEWLTQDDRHLLQIVVASIAEDGTVTEPGSRRSRKGDGAVPSSGVSPASPGATGD